MKIVKLMMAVAIVTTIGFVGCKPKDADIKAAVEAQLKTKPDMANATVNVNDGVATIAGECKDETCKAECEKMTKDVKGVKEVVNNLTVAPPPPPPTVTAPVSVTGDVALSQAVTDATKDFSSVKASVNEGIVTLTGTIKKSELPKLMQSLSALKPKKIDTKQLTVN